MTRNHRTMLAAALLGCMLLGPATEARAGQPLVLDDLIAEAKRQNPEIQAARDRALAMASIPKQVSALDDPTLSWEAWNIPDSLRVNRADNNIFRVAQKLPFPGKRRLAGDVATYEAERESYDAASVELQVITEVKVAYATLWEAHERLAILRREQELVQRFARIAEQRYATGGATQADLLRAQGELSHVATDLALEPLNVESARAELNTLLGRRPDEPLGEPAPMPVPRLDLTPQALADLALGNRPDLAAQSSTIAREESAEELAHKSYYPDFEVSVGRFVNYGASDGFGAMASVTLPFANLGKYDAGVAEARARLVGARGAQASRGQGAPRGAADVPEGPRGAAALRAARRHAPAAERRGDARRGGRVRDRHARLPRRGRHAAPHECRAPRARDGAGRLRARARRARARGRRGAATQAGRSAEGEGSWLDASCRC
ncbi:TolC family protein [Candidatus Binatia bacterium]|nr:TolC family protein [Candidatus Binatia bacterium]